MSLHGSPVTAQQYQGIFTRRNQLAGMGAANIGVPMSPVSAVAA
jgi:hypothetical protein